MKRRDFLNSSLLAAAIYVPGIRAAYAVVGTDQVPDIAAITGDGREITLKGADIRELAAQMRGRLLIAGDDGYDKARQILNPSFDKHPALIAQPTGAADVQAVVTFARANNLLVAVKCGGHSHSGQSTCDRGLQIDLSSFRGVRVDPRSTARLGRGRHAARPGGLRVRGARSRDTARHGLAYRRRWPHDGWWLRPARPKATAWPSTTSSRSTWSPPTENFGTRVRRTTRICSGRYVAVAATSAS